MPQRWMYICDGKAITQEFSHRGERGARGDDGTEGVCVIEDAGEEVADEDIEDC